MEPDRLSTVDRRTVLHGMAAAPVAGALGGGSTKRRVRLGVNYVPSRNWWFSWSDWDRASITRDLADIAGLGVDHIRIMCLWPDFQPNAGHVRGEMLDRLAELLDLADTVRLDVEVTVFNGALSGFLFVPPWLIDNSTGRTRNIFTDPVALAGQHALLEAIAARVGAHRRFLGFDLSNEVNWFAQPLGMNITPEQGDAWHTALFATCERVAPGRLHVSGIDHYPWLNDAYFTREGLATSGTATACHTWAGWTNVIQRYGPLSTPSLHYSEYFVELLKAFHTDLRRTVWIEETGVSTKWMDAAVIPEWTERSIRNMAACGQLFGITWWCSHDLSPRLTGFNPLEYDLGLLSRRGDRKPIGAVVARLAREFDHHPPRELPRPVALVLPDGAVPGLSFLLAWAKLVDQGVRPAIVRQGRSTDLRYLAARGIDRVVLPD
ncbi:glycoside hydrolase 5 family protein [Allokutzneria oryzae]|uniref:Glycoside hydrolase family 5 domain-containing protein n=1 Tax=Allokutzneria oryzae TaxID=1378989 RepID=A0ABV6A2P9_9PSEU